MKLFTALATAVICCMGNPAQATPEVRNLMNAYDLNRNDPAAACPLASMALSLDRMQTVTDYRLVADMYRAADDCGLRY